VVTGEVEIHTLTTPFPRAFGAPDTYYATKVDSVTGAPIVVRYSRWRQIRPRRRTGGYAEPSSSRSVV